jgi:hypothetical protein
MISIARKFLVASLIYLILGLFSQAVAIFDVWLGFNPLAYTAVSTTEQILLVGWLTQLGLALIYDRWLSRLNLDVKSSSEGQEATASTRRSDRGMVVFVLFNLGLLLAIIGQPGLAIFGGQGLGAVAALGGLLQLFAGIVFVLDVWHTLRRK